MKQYIPLGNVITKSSVERCGDRVFPILSITMKDGLVMQDEKFKKRIASVDTADYKVIPRGKLVQGIHIDEANFGVQDIVDFGIVSPAYKIWDIKTDIVIPKYLEIIMRSPRSLAYYTSKLNGSVNRRGRMSDEDFLNMPIPYTDLNEQGKILGILNKAKAIIQNRQATLDALDMLIKARFVEMFGHCDYPYTELIELIIDGAGLSYGIVQPGDDGTGDMGVLRPVDLSDGRITTATIKYIDRSIGEGFKKTELTGEELLITVRGTTGITALTDTRFSGMNVTRGIAVIRYDRDKINPIYLNAYLNSEESQRYIREHTRGATLQQINLSDLRVQQILVPPRALQDKYSAFVQQVDKSKSVIQTALAKDQLLFDSLMQKYFG